MGGGMSDIRIGTSGWSYDHWNSVLHEPSLAPRDRLRRYTQEFDDGRAERELLPMAAAADVPRLATSATARIPERFQLQITPQSVDGNADSACNRAFEGRPSANNECQSVL